MNGTKESAMSQNEDCRPQQPAAGTGASVLVHGRQRTRITLGRYPIISLSQARDKAKTILAEQTLGTHVASNTNFETVMPSVKCDIDAELVTAALAEARAGVDGIKDYVDKQQPYLVLRVRRRSISWLVKTRAATRRLGSPPRAKFWTWRFRSYASR
jgi:hypothetical protein